MPIPNQDVFQLLSDVYRRLGDNHTLGSLSRRIGWSKFHLHRGFRRIMGETARQHIQRLRLERAATMLAVNPETILSVALSTGFNSNEVFGRAFRRAYGCTPTQYRAFALAGTSRPDRVHHQNLVQSVGPCVHLYGCSNMGASGRQAMPAPSIIRKEVPAQPVLYIQRRVARTQLQPLFAECFPKLFGHCMAKGHAIAGQPVARYVSMGSGLWTIDCAIPLSEPAPTEGEIQAGFLQEGPVAFAVHEGEYERLPETNAAIETWIEENAYCASGPAWEVYVTSPAEYPDVADWKTEVYWPLAE